MAKAIKREKITWVDRFHFFKVTNSFLIVLHLQVQFRSLHNGFNIFIIKIDGCIKIFECKISLMKLEVSASTIK